MTDLPTPNLPTQIPVDAQIGGDGPVEVHRNMGRTAFTGPGILERLGEMGSEVKNAGSEPYQHMASVVVPERNTYTPGSLAIQSERRKTQQAGALASRQLTL
jgi:hypothetical protein